MSQAPASDYGARVLQWMPRVSFHSLLREAPQGRHLCQLHQGSATLDAALVEYVEAGLRRNDAVIVLASDRRLALLRHRCGTGAAALERSAQLVLRNAAAVMQRFMQDGEPQWPSFRATVGELIERAQGHGWHRLRVYGEIVDDLWRAGNPRAAIRLEEFWNRLAGEYCFCLFCGYEIDATRTSARSEPVHDIGRTHSDVLPTLDDHRLQAAVDRAGREVLGYPLCDIVAASMRDAPQGTRKLPLARQAVLWLHRNVPSAVDDVLARVRELCTDQPERGHLRR